MKLTEEQQRAVARAAAIIENRGYEYFLSWVSENLARYMETTRAGESGRTAA